MNRLACIGTLLGLLNARVHPGEAQEPQANPATPENTRARSELCHACQIYIDSISSDWDCGVFLVERFKNQPELPEENSPAQTETSTAY